MEKSTNYIDSRKNASNIKVSNLPELILQKELIGLKSTGSLMLLKTLSLAKSVTEIDAGFDRVVFDGVF